MSPRSVALTLDRFTSFGDLLKYLRRRVGLTQRELSIAVGYSEAHICRLEQNQRQPDLATITARFVPALDIEDEPGIVAQLLALAAHVQNEDAPEPGSPPFKGLPFFDEGDADIFFGREALTEKLAARLISLPSPSTQVMEKGEGMGSEVIRFLAVVGASGSGKSSLVRAGLIPALRQCQLSAAWPIHVLTPTAHPLAALAAVLVPQAGPAAAFEAELARDASALHRAIVLKAQQTGASRVVLVVDQFEELFSLCRNDAERVAFVDGLTAATCAPGRAVTTLVILVLRADFYSHCARFPWLREALAQQQVFIGPMTPEELRRAIEEPARRHGWDFEPGLVDLLLRDIGADGPHPPEPGALPLLSHALLETWRRRRGRTLTLSGYTAAGGVRGAIAETAEAVLQDQLDERQRRIARRIFLCLVEPAEEAYAADTRRRASFAELIPASEDGPAVRAVLEILADARLITMERDAVEIAHEALVREWPALRSWLDEDREALRLRRSLTVAAQEWEKLNRDPGALYRGTRLAQVLDWVQWSGRAQDLSAVEHEFLQVSRTQAEQEAAQREAQRERELQAARELAEAEMRRAEVQTRAAKQLRRRALFLGVALALFVVGALVAGIFAKRAATLAAQNAAIAATARADFGRAEALRLAAVAQTLSQIATSDLDLVALLSIRSLNMMYSSQADAALQQWAADDYTLRLFFPSVDREIRAVAFSPDGRFILTNSYDGTRMWDVQTGQEIRQFADPLSEWRDWGAVAYSPDGQYLLTNSEAAAQLWDAATGQKQRRFAGFSDQVTGVAFSPDGTWVAASSLDKTARVWDLRTAQELLRLDHPDGVMDVGFSPDGRYLLTACVDGIARLWDARTGREVLQFVGHRFGVAAVAFSHDGRYVATAGWDTTARLWDAQTGQELRSFWGHAHILHGVAFSPDDRYLVTSSADRTARLWDVQSGRELRRFTGHRGEIQEAVFSPDGQYVLTASDDHTARLWRVRGSTHQFLERGACISAVKLSPDSQYLVTVTLDKEMRLWDVQSGQELRDFVGPTDTITSLAFSPDGKLVLTGHKDNTARLWDVQTGQVTRQFANHTGEVTDVTFSPDGKYALSSSTDKTVRLWDTQTSQELRRFTSSTGLPFYRVAFSPGARHVVASAYTLIMMWDAQTGEQLQRIDGAPGVFGAMALSPDGQYVLSGGSMWGPQVWLWDLQTGQYVQTLSGHTDLITGVAFSPDGRYGLTVSGDRTARLWDAITGAPLRVFVGHTGMVLSLAFSPDGKYFVTGGCDSTIRLWETDYQDLIRNVCTRIRRDFTDEERAQYNITDTSPTCPGPLNH